MTFFKLPVLAVLSLVIAFPAFAGELSAARDAGLVGERHDGYVQVIKPSPATTALVKKINNQRRAKYQELAAKNGTSVQAVGAITAQKIWAKLPVGSWIMDPSGNWRRK